MFPVDPRPLAPQMAAVLAVFALSGCPSAPSAAKTIEPTFSAIQRQVFNTSCSSTSCHGAPGFKGGLNLEEGAAYKSLVGILPDNATARARGLKRVDPGNTETSFLVVKLVGPGAGEGSRMPSRNAAISPQALAAIQEWIRKGANP